MTFTEAAVEVLRRAGKPLHYKEIAEQAVRENLLSHVGQDPEITMGQRLAAMAKREDDRKVVAVAPDGTFALSEWNVPPEAGGEPAFIVDGERVSLVEFPPPTALPEPAELRVPHAGGARPMSAAQLVAEGRRAVVRALRRRLAELEISAFEALCSSLLEKMGMRDVRVAKRSKEGPLYLARQRRGVSDLRVAVKLVRGAREIGRADVQELRKDLAHYSAQMGLVPAPGEAGRDARAEASAAGQPPVALYAGDALAEALVSLRVGVSVQVVELADVDEAFFASAARGTPSHRERRERTPEERIERPEAAENARGEKPA